MLTYNGLPVLASQAAFRKARRAERNRLARNES